MKKFLAVLPFAAIAACASVEDVRNRPVAWAATYNTRWEAMANCIQSKWIDIVVVTPQYDQRKRTAVLTLTAQGLLAPGAVEAEYEIKQAGGEDQSEVVFRRRRSLLGTDADGRAIADRCGRG